MQQNKNTGRDFERQVADAVRQSNYKVILEPWSKPDHSTWLDRIATRWMRPTGSPFVPDMMVAHGDKVAVVEAKSYPVLLGPVIQARHYADYFEAPAIICVPDDAFPQIPNSVREWAETNDVILTPLGEIGHKLDVLLHQSVI